MKALRDLTLIFEGLEQVHTIKLIEDEKKLLWIGRSLEQIAGLVSQRVMTHVRFRSQTLIRMPLRASMMI